MAIFDSSDTLIDQYALSFSTPNAKNGGQNWGFSLDSNTIKSFVPGGRLYRGVRSENDFCTKPRGTKPDCTKPRGPDRRARARKPELAGPGCCRFGLQCYSKGAAHASCTAASACLRSLFQRHSACAQFLNLHAFALLGQIQCFSSRAGH